MVKTRHATSADLTEILRVHESAFGEVEGPEIVGLVTELLGDRTALPLHSLVAETDGRVVGHILFTAVRLPSGPRPVLAQILAPLAVSSDFQAQGVGISLVNDGLKDLAAAGVELVFVLGHPGYYPRFGFRPAGVLGFEAPYPIPPHNEDAWMVHELQPGTIGTVRGKIQCALTLDQPQHWCE